MKVILAAKTIYPFHPFGGIQKYVYHYAKYLSQEGVDVEIVAPVDDGKPRTEEREGIKYTLLAPSIQKYLELPIGWLGVHLFSRNLMKYLKTVDFDILHSFDMTGYQYLKERNRKAVISQVFTDNYLCNPIPFWNILNLSSLFGRRTEDIKKKKIALSPFSSKKLISKYPLQYFFKIKPMQFCLNRSEAVFIEEDIFRDEIANIFHINKDKCIVMPVGTDLSFIHSQISQHSLSRNDLGLKDNDLVLITVNRLAADKGVDKIVLALAGMKKELPQAKLIIIGSGYQEKELSELIAQKDLTNHVRHFKNISEEKLYVFYAMSDIYISAFSYPGSSISTLEAMACGLPVITTAQPWLIRNGENGVILESNEPDLIKDAIMGLSKKGQLKQGGQVSNDIVQNYDWKRIVQLAKEQYKGILSIAEKKEKYIDICNVHVSSVNIDSACKTIEQWITDRTKTYVCVAPASMIVDCQSNKDYLKIINNAGMVTPDGMSLVWLGKLKGSKVIQRTYGADLMIAFCQISQSRPYRHYLYGGTGDTNRLLKQVLLQRFPKLDIVGRRSPPFKDFTTEVDAEAIEEINRLKPDIVWVGLGSPKQDYWMCNHRDKLNAPVMVGVGAAFDFLSGIKKQAPKWMQRSGLEWLFRFFTEPKRLWKRYLVGNTKFVYYLMKDYLSQLSNQR